MIVVIRESATARLVQRADGVFLWRPNAKSRRAGLLGDRNLGSDRAEAERRFDARDDEIAATIELFGAIAPPAKFPPAPRHPLDMPGSGQITAELGVGGRWVICRGGRPVIADLSRHEALDVLRRNGGTVLSDEGGL